MFIKYWDKIIPEELDRAISVPKTKAEDHLVPVLEGVE